MQQHAYVFFLFHWYRTVLTRERKRRNLKLNASFALKNLRVIDNSGANEPGLFHFEGFYFAAMCRGRC